MDEENKSYEDDQDYHDEFEDTFEIGIPIEDTLSTLQKDKAPENETEADEVADVEPDQETEDAAQIIVSNDPAQETSLPSSFDEIKSQIQGLYQAFESKLKYDEHKNKIIDDLHESLQEYRDGLVKKYIHRIITDIIKIVDDMRKFTAHHKKQDASEETTEKLFRYIENIASDLEDLFAWEGVVPFTCSGDMVDLSRQRILNKIETDDPEKDKTVAERLRPGYEWDGKVIRPEMVSAYVYQKESTAEDNNS